MSIAGTVSTRPVEQLSRPALLYLLAVLVSSCLLLLDYMAVWLLAVGGMCVIWRFLAFTGRCSLPGRLWKTLLVLAMCVGIGLQHRTGVSLDVFVSLLLAGLSLKALEVYHLRDARLFLYVAVLVVMAYLLYAQGFLPAVFGFMQTLLIVAALVAIHTDVGKAGQGGFAPLRGGLLTMLFAIPVLLVLFVVMPRLPPLWAMPLQKAQAKTGMSDDMQPGDVNNLTRSAELVMRVTFNGDVIPVSEMYWRGMLLDTFDGRSWRNACDCNYQWLQTGSGLAPVVQPDHQIILQPHGQKWLFTLQDSRLYNKWVWGSSEGTFRYARDVRERLAYAVWQKPAVTKQFNLTAEQRTRNTALPQSGNMRARALAQEWRSASVEDADVVQKALDLYHASFTYTLQPPSLGKESVDEFLFGSRQGFCEHFAGSFVFLMRAAGIPARVVLGYQGGEIVSAERYVNVRQYDAHAWAEVWFEKRGWIRVDPTSAVAPERIELGFAGLFPESEALSTGFGLNAYRAGSLLNFVRMKLDYMDYIVARWVLDYDTRSQQSLLERLGLDSPLRLLAWFLGLAVFAFAVFLFYLQWRDRLARREAPLVVAYRRVCARYARGGVIRSPGETPCEYAQRVQAAGLREADSFQSYSQQFADICYAPVPAVDEKNLLRSLRGLGWRLWRIRT
jgi:transglutaminase-like putative cysteine protease